MKLLDFLKDGGQIFDGLTTYPEWLTNDIQGAVQAQLIDYSLRRIQPRVQLLADQLDEEVEEVVQMLVKARIDRNSYKYETLLATESFDYNPIENYNMIESESGSFDKGQEVDTTLHGHQLQRTHANSDTLTLNTLEGRQSAAHITGSSSSTEGARSDSTTKSVYGINSTDPVPADVESFSKGAQQNSATSGSDSTGGETIQRTGTETNAHAGTITDANSGTDTMTSGTRKDTHARSLTRSGNIGVTTSQQMIESEREVANFSFLKILTEDLVNSFCLGVM